ncbi:hypothetical protein ADT71_02870 [Novosphingobium sp. ST904]|nr:hypothetical protein ADT71_02870 [Novosphingobium sp. ST904]
MGEGLCQIMAIFRTLRDDDADVAGCETCIISQPSLHDGRRGLAFGQGVSDGQYGQAVIELHDRDIRIQKMALYMACQTRSGCTCQLPVRNQTNDVIIFFAQLAMMGFDVLEHRALQRGQLNAVSIPDNLQRLQSITCVTRKESLERRKIGRNKGIAADPEIAQGIQMKARPALAR